MQPPTTPPGHTVKIRFTQGRLVGQYRDVSPVTAAELIRLGWAEHASPIRATTSAPCYAVPPRPQSRG